jgi:hypothetical protein
MSSPMSLTRVPLLAATACCLVLVAPAAAVSGFGVSSALRPGKAVMVALTKQQSSKNQTCQAQNQDRKALPSKLSLIGNAHKFAVVACEQPPRSQFVAPTVIKQVANELATIG